MDRPWQAAAHRRDLLAVGGLGFTGYYLASFLDFAGLQYISASVERLVLYLNPTLVLLIGALLFGKRVSGRQLLALAISYVGVLLAFVHEVGHQGADAWLGAALVFGSAVSYAVYLAFSGQEVKRLGALRLTGLASSVACVLCIAQFFVLRPAETLWVAPAVLWLSLLNATLCTFAPVLLVMVAIERVGAALTAQTGMIGPLTTLLLGALVLASPSPSGWPSARCWCWPASRCSRGPVERLRHPRQTANDQPKIQSKSIQGQAHATRNRR